MHKKADSALLKHLSREQAVSDVIEAVSLEKAALAEILSVEKEIACYVRDNCRTAEERRTLNDSIVNCMNHVLKLQMLLDGRLEDIVDLENCWYDD